MLSILRLTSMLNNSPLGKLKSCIMVRWVAILRLQHLHSQRFIWTTLHDPSADVNLWIWNCTWKYDTSPSPGVTDAMEMMSFRPAGVISTYECDLETINRSVFLLIDRKSSSPVLFFHTNSSPSLQPPPLSTRSVSTDYIMTFSHRKEPSRCR